MTLEPIVKRFANPNAVIDIHHPDWYCAKCDECLRAKSSFSIHLKRVHSLQVKSFVNPNAEIDI